MKYVMSVHAPQICADRFQRRATWYSHAEFREAWSYFQALTRPEEFIGAGARQRFATMYAPRRGVRRARSCAAMLGSGNRVSAASSESVSQAPHSAAENRMSRSTSRWLRQRSWSNSLVKPVPNAERAVAGVFNLAGSFWCILIHFD